MEGQAPRREAGAIRPCRIDVADPDLVPFLLTASGDWVARRRQSSPPTGSAGRSPMLVPFGRDRNEKNIPPRDGAAPRRSPESSQPRCRVGPENGGLAMPIDSPAVVPTPERVA